AGPKVDDPPAPPPYGPLPPALLDIGPGETNSRPGEPYDCPAGPPRVPAAAGEVAVGCVPAGSPRRSSDPAPWPVPSVLPSPDGSLVAVCSSDTDVSSTAVGLCPEPAETPGALPVPGEA